MWEQYRGRDRPPTRVFRIARIAAPLALSVGALREILIIEARSHERPRFRRRHPTAARPETLLIRMTEAEAGTAHAGLRLTEDVGRLRGRIEQMAALASGSTIRLRDGRSFPVPADPTARQQLAMMVILIEIGNFLSAHGLDPKGRRLVSRMAPSPTMPAASPTPCSRSPAAPAMTARSIQRRAPHRLDADLAIGADAAIYRRGQAGQSHQLAAVEVAILDRIGLRTPLQKRRGRDDAGTSDPENRRWAGPGLLGLFYQAQEAPQRPRKR